MGTFEFCSEEKYGEAAPRLAFKGRDNWGLPQHEAAIKHQVWSWPACTACDNNHHVADIMDAFYL